MAINNTLAKKEQSFSTFLALPAVRKKIFDVVAGDRGSQFIASIATSVGANPAVAECDYSSILTSALLGEALKLSPSPQLGQFYMVPYNDKNRGKLAQFQLGYKGYIQLAIRSGQYRKINVMSIKEGELIQYDALNEDIEVKLIDDEEARENAVTIGYYAMFELVNGFRKTMYWSLSKMQAHAKKYSQGYAADLKKGTSWTFWSKDFDGMAYKTMLRQLISKWGIMSIDLQTAITNDMGVIKDDGAVDYVDGADSEIFKPAVVTSDEPVAQQTAEPAPAESAQEYEDQDDVVNMFFGGGKK